MFMNPKNKEKLFLPIECRVKANLIHSWILLCSGKVKDLLFSAPCSINFFS